MYAVGISTEIKIVTLINKCQKIVYNRELMDNQD